MSSNCDTLSNNSRSSHFNDGMEVILADIESFENCSNRSTPESHRGCTRRFEPEASPPENEQVFQLADEFQLGAEWHEQPQEPLEAPSQDGGLEDADESRRKRKRSEDDSTPRNFGHDITNIRATSVPVIELPPEKCRKIRRNFELFKGGLLAKVMQEVVGTHHTSVITISIATKTHAIELITTGNVEVRLRNDIQLLKDGVAVLMMLRDVRADSEVVLGSGRSSPGEDRRQGRSRLHTY
ncbi:hypothetical protein EV702DRAFT_1234014 [Suillus placidus]|uniref:Uncharacterized protein n=1 Tax=Suillus placidus TaxID=48579 RepID=A0A9P6ZS75_9AGAM|nr:hypothetical protein EV702DRAFT_1234014 [Suillus placidus]